MKAILALSARHISLNPSIAGEQTHDRNDALQYYNETLHYLSKAMQYDTYKTSLELLATVLIVSTYEMLDGSGKDWERHLQGVFWIQRSQVIHGDSKGLKQGTSIYRYYLRKYQGLGVQTCLCKRLLLTPFSSVYQILIF